MLQLIHISRWQFTRKYLVKIQICHRNIQFSMIIDWCHLLWKNFWPKLSWTLSICYNSGNVINYINKQWNTRGYQRIINITSSIQCTYMDKVFHYWVFHLNNRNIKAIFKSYFFFQSATLYVKNPKGCQSFDKHTDSNAFL